ncbi:MAG: hypothetical protein PUB34_07110 [Clostridia bacterium]|nr:hypothetical protein [Clostridia bacterium]
MPSAMIHLDVGRKVGKYIYGSETDAPAEFYVGTLAPDCVENPRELKDRLHLRDLSCVERRVALANMASETPTGKSFKFGCLVHLFTDVIWDEGPQAYHMEGYIGANWFRDYRHEISLASAYMFHYCEWTKDIWEKMLGVNLEEHCSDIPEYTPEAIFKYLKYTSEKQAENFAGVSPAFSPDTVNDFCKNASERFIRFYTAKGFKNG